MDSRSSFLVSESPPFSPPGKVDESSTLRVSSFHLGGLESCHVTQLPFAEIAAAAVARGVLLPLIATIEKRLKGGCGSGCVNVINRKIAVVARGVCSLSSPPSKKGLKVGVVGGAVA